MAVLLKPIMITDEQSTFENIEAVFSNGQRINIPKNGIVTVDPPIATKFIWLMLKSKDISGLGKITIRTIGEQATCKE